MVAEVCTVYYRGWLVLGLTHTLTGVVRYQSGYIVFSCHACGLNTLHQLLNLTPTIQNDFHLKLQDISTIGVTQNNRGYHPPPPERENGAFACDYPPPEKSVSTVSNSIFLVRMVRNIVTVRNMNWQVYCINQAHSSKWLWKRNPIVNEEGVHRAQYWGRS